MEVGISSNKVVFPFSWRFLVMVLHRSTGRSPVRSFYQAIKVVA
jgi:hypothetical protein